MSGDQDSVEIQLNGAARHVPAGVTVADLLADLGFDSRTVAIERNGSILARDRFEKVDLEPGDRLEIVRFVQGGRGCSREAD